MGNGAPGTTSKPYCLSVERKKLTLLWSYLVLALLCTIHPANIYSADARSFVLGAGDTENNKTALVRWRS